MAFNRLLRYINIAIILIVVAAGLVLYWFVYRPMPRASGSFAVRVSAPVTVLRDDLGVPHITANTEDDAYFAQGFVTAQDRMWQMEGLRRLAAGELAEIGGAAAVEADRDARLLRMRSLAEAAEQAMNAEERRFFSAYARGVNAYLQSHRDKLPLEFKLAGVEPRAWRVTDSILIYYQLFRTLTTSWKRDLDKAAMMTGGNSAAVETLLPSRSGGDAHPGSNAWVLSGKHTATGKPILANDMHLDQSIPGIWYQTHLQVSGKLNVSGVVAPGLPGIVVGHNDRVAWGITNLEFDVQDLYIEEVDAGGRFRRGDQWMRARPEREVMLVKGARPVELGTLFTDHGPIIRADGKDQYSLHWVAFEPGTFRYVTFDVDRARDWSSFREALRVHSGPGLNFVYADVDGNIGYQVVGKLPIRRGYDGSTPVTGNQNWDGFIPYDSLPSVYNPPSGIVVTANEDLFGNFAYPVSGHFAPPYRGQQIRARLQKRQGWKAEDMLSVQMDVYSAFSAFLAQQLVAAYDKLKPTTPVLQEAVPLLRNWNGLMDVDKPQPLIVSLAFQHFRRALADVAAPGNEYRAQISFYVVEKLLRERPAGWFENYDETLMQELTGALEEGERMQGRDIGKWTYGRYNRLALMHPIGSRLMWVSKYFNIGPVEISGSPVTVKQSTGRIGPSMRMSADTADWDRSLLNIVTGQSGHVLSKHYKDQWDAYYNGTSFPMQYGKVTGGDTLQLVPAGR